MEDLQKNEKIELNAIFDEMIMNNFSFSLLHNELIIDKNKSSYILRIINHDIEMDINIEINHDYQIIKYDYHELRIKNNNSDINDISIFLHFIKNYLNFKRSISFDIITKY